MIVIWWGMFELFIAVIPFILAFRIGVRIMNEFYL